MSELKKTRSAKHKNKSRGARKSSDKVDETEETEKIIIDDVNRLYQKRGLESNWYRYEPREDDTEDRSRDFTLLSSVPVSAGGYFQFKNDNIEAKPIENKAFHLDLTLLSKSIMTVPFHVRCGIDEKYFSEKVIKAMNETAKKNVPKYNEYLETLSRNKSDHKMEEQNMIGNTQLNVEFKALLMYEVKDKQEGKRVECAKQKNICEHQKTESDAGDLEQWLDDILDE